MDDTDLTNEVEHDKIDLVNPIENGSTTNPEDFSAKASQQEFLNGVGSHLESTQEEPPPQVTSEDLYSKDLVDKFPIQTLEFANGKVAFRDIVPESLRENTDIPMLMMAGWAMNQEVIGNTIENLYKEGVHALPVDFIGGGKGIKGEKGTSSQINRQAELLKGFIDQLPQQKVDIVGQSMAALTILSLAKRNPEILEKIRNIILVSPMGLGGEDSKLELLKRKMAEDKRNKGVEKTEEDLEVEKRALKSFGKHITKTPVRALQELLAMTNADEYASLDLLKEKGIRVGILQGDLDLLNSNKRVWNKIGEGSNSPWKTLTQEEYDRDLRYKEQGIKVGDKVWDKESSNTNPSFDSITMIDGGHEVFGQGKVADKIIRSINYLNKSNIQQ